ncbi:MAG: SDR family NAD(P)-dependent oxidoreductase [candidate division FCPU426 bacterium]
MEKILIIGATSAMARETARLYAREGAAFLLAARDPKKLSALAAELRKLGATKTVCFPLDVNRRQRHSLLLQKIKALGGADVALIAHATPVFPGPIEKNPDLLPPEVETNFTGTLLLLLRLAAWFEQQGRGTIAVLTSVAGDRGRRDQYVYAACKAGVTVFLQGLRQRLRPAGVAVVTIKPGLTDTPLTAALPKNPLYARPAAVARGIRRAIRAKAVEAYVPWFWRYIMWGITFLPESWLPSASGKRHAA